MMKVGCKYTHTHSHYRIMYSCILVFAFLCLLDFICFAQNKLKRRFARQAEKAAKAAAKRTACFPFCHKNFISFCCVVYACFFPIIFHLVCCVSFFVAVAVTRNR